MSSTTNTSAVRPLMTRQDVADVLGVSLDTVERLQRGAGLPVMYIGRQIRIRPDALERWLEDVELGPRSEDSADAAA